MYSSTGGTQIKYVLTVSLLLSGLLGAIAAASAGGSHTYIEVGGIPSSQKSGESSSSSELYRRIEKSLPGGGGSVVGDPVKRLDGSATGRGSSVVPDTGKRHGDSLSGGGSSTFPWSNKGTFPHEPTTIGQPSNQFCSSSSTDVTIGPDTQSTGHCLNTVGGTLRQ